MWNVGAWLAESVVVGQSLMVRVVTSHAVCLDGKILDPNSPIDCPRRGV